MWKLNEEKQGVASNVLTISRLDRQNPGNNLPNQEKKAVCAVRLVSEECFFYFFRFFAFFLCNGDHHHQDISSHPQSP